MDFRDVTGMDTPELNSIQTEKPFIKGIKCISSASSIYIPPTNHMF